VQKLKERIQKAIKEQKDLEKLAKQIEITITPEGLRIELIEDKSGTFFQSGSAKLEPERTGTPWHVGRTIEAFAQSPAAGRSYRCATVLRRQCL
jgi:flagellar motor protein MotB